MALAGVEQGGEPAGARELVVVDEDEQALAAGLVQGAVAARDDAGLGLVDVDDLGLGAGPAPSESAPAGRTALAVRSAPPAGSLSTTRMRTRARPATDPACSTSAGSSSAR